MTNRLYFHILIDGRPQRLYINSATKERCAVPAGAGLDGPNEFPSEDAATTRAEQWGLRGYRIAPAPRDLGRPTNLAEIGL